MPFIYGSRRVCLHMITLICRSQYWSGICVYEQMYLKNIIKRTSYLIDISLFCKIQIYRSIITDGIVLSLLLLSVISPCCQHKSYTKKRVVWYSTDTLWLPYRRRFLYYSFHAKTQTGLQLHSDLNYLLRICGSEWIVGTSTSNIEDHQNVISGLLIIKQRK